MGTKGKKKRITNTISDVGTSIKHKVSRQKAEDEEIMLGTGPTCSIEVTDAGECQGQRMTSFDDEVDFCRRCGPYANIKEVKGKKRCAVCKRKIKGSNTSSRHENSRRNRKRSRNAESGDGQMADELTTNNTGGKKKNSKKKKAKKVRNKHTICKQKWIKRN